MHIRPASLHPTKQDHTLTELEQATYAEGKPANVDDVLGKIQCARAAERESVE